MSSSSGIQLDVGLASELKLAFRRHGYSLQDIQRLKEGDILGRVLGVLHGTHEIVEVVDDLDYDKIKKVPVACMNPQAELAIIQARQALRPRWREENGVIYFSVTSDGTTGPEWIKRLESKGFHIGDEAKGILHSPHFEPTSGVTTRIAILKDGKPRNPYSYLKNPNKEVACLIREKFSDEDLMAMGLCWIMIMHEPFKDLHFGHSINLTVQRGSKLRKDNFLGSYIQGETEQWGPGAGCAVFAVSQVKK